MTKPHIYRTFGYELSRERHWSGGLVSRRAPRWHVEWECAAGEYTTWDFADACGMAKFLYMKDFRR